MNKKHTEYLLAALRSQAIGHKREAQINEIKAELLEKTAWELELAIDKDKNKPSTIEPDPE